MFVTICFILSLKGISGLFVEIGDYPEHQRLAQVNLPRCGHTAVPQVIRYEKSCFTNNHPNKTFVIPHGRHSPNEKVSEVTSRIYKGRDAMVGESPWTVRLDISTFETDANGRKTRILTRCSGSLITFEWIITAAHCFVGKLDRKPIIKILAGSGNWRNFVNLNKIFINPDYITLPVGSSYTKNRYDIAMIKLIQKYSPNLYDRKYYFLNTICLPKVTQLNKNYEDATFSGWGITDINGTLPKRLQIEDATLLESRRCTPGFLCAYMFNTGPKTCTGDSGGPLVQFTDEEIPRGILIGVLWGGITRCGPGAATAYWNPPMRFIKWILDTILDN